ncbi:MAG: dioxygenase [Streptosporangiales bacterium]|nr:dioxygenase [Streptosporangiales bacterium]
MTETANTSRPLYLQGHLAPVPDEIDAVELDVTGSLPAELTGRYFRNGPNPRPGEDPGHWFAGHGMLHGLRLRDGRAEWYRNRWVRTKSMEGGAEYVRPDLSVDLAAVPANTHVIPCGDRILALVEAGLPYEISPELETLGPVDFGGRLTTAMTAHPKLHPLTGELHFFGYGFFPPYLTYHRLSAAGELVESRVIDVPGPTMAHDFAITENHVVWMDLPAVFDLSLAGTGMPVRWDDAYGARLGVMPRGGDVTWYDIDPCYVFHVSNAREDQAGRIVLDAARYSPADFNRIWSGIGGTADPAAAAAATGAARLYRWTLDPATGRATEEPLDDRPVEFPTLNDDRVGLGNRYAYAVTGSVTGPESDGDGIVKYDLPSGRATVHRLDDGLAAGEAVFVPAAGGTAEDDGWLLSIVSDRAGRGSAFVVLDATDVEAGPVATVRLPRRVPAGFHGSWIPDPQR